MHRSRAALAVLVLALAPVAARADDTQPPLIRHTPVAKANKGDTLTISADMEDDSEIFAPTLYFRYPGAKSYSSIPMTKKGGATFFATVPATADVEYWIEAYDEFGNGPTREGSPDRPHKVVVTDRTASKAPPVARAEPPPSPPPPPRTPPPKVLDVKKAVAEIPPPHADEPQLAPEPPEPPAEEAPPIYKQWWFIGGGAVVAAAVVVGLVVALQPAPVQRDVFAATLTHP